MLSLFEFKLCQFKNFHTLPEDCTSSSDYAPQLDTNRSVDSTIKLEIAKMSRGGRCNTPPESQGSILSSHLDYFSVSGSIATSNVGEVRSLLYKAIAKVLPAPNEDGCPNWDDLFNKHFEEHRDPAASATYATLRMSPISSVVDSNIQFAKKPYRVNDILFLENRLETKLPIQGGYTIDHTSENPELKYMFRFSGKFFEMLDISSTRKFLQVWFETMTSCSRIDIAIDDPSYQIIPFDNCLESCLEGNFAGFITYDLRPDLRYKYDENKPELHPEHTLYLGSRKSKEFTRIYNHKNKYLRWETEYKDSLANKCYAQLIDADHLTDTEWCGLLGELAIGARNFLDRTAPTGIKEKNIKRCKVLLWWDKFLDYIGEPIRLPRPTPAIALSATWNWITKQVSSFLGAAYTAMGEEKFMKYLESEFERHLLKPSRSFLGYVSAIELENELVRHSY